MSQLLVTLEHFHISKTLPFTNSVQGRFCLNCVMVAAVLFDIYLSPSGKSLLKAVHRKVNALGSSVLGSVARIWFTASNFHLQSIMNWWLLHIMPYSVERKCQRHEGLTTDEFRYTRFCSISYPQPNCEPVACIATFPALLKYIMQTIGLATSNSCASLISKWILYIFDRRVFNVHGDFQEYKPRV